MGQGSTNLVYTILGFQVIIVIGFHHNCWWNLYHGDKDLKFPIPTSNLIQTNTSPRITTSNEKALGKQFTIFSTLASN
jgi:hypothetical protein